MKLKDPRPVAEIMKMLDKVFETYEKVSQIISKNIYSKISDEIKELKLEQQNLEALGAFLHVVLHKKEHPDARFSLARFKSCKIITRHLVGDDRWTLDRVYARSTERVNEIKKHIQDFSNSEEYVYMQKLNTALGWVFDDLKDSSIGLHFSWRMFSTKIKDDFILRGKEKDEFNTPERVPLEEQAHRKLTQIHEKIIDSKLEKKFTFMKKDAK